MVSAHPEYGTYMTCCVCGLKKGCRLDGRRYVCFSCDNGNFNGIRNIINKQRRHENGNEP